MAGPPGLLVLARATRRRRAAPAPSPPSHRPQAAPAPAAYNASRPRWIVPGGVPGLLAFAAARLRWRAGGAAPRRAVRCHAVSEVGAPRPRGLLRLRRAAALVCVPSTASSAANGRASCGFPPARRARACALRPHLRVSLSVASPSSVHPRAAARPLPPARPCGLPPFPVAAVAAYADY